MDLDPNQREEEEGTDAPSLDELGRLGETHARGLCEAERVPTRHRRWIASHGGVEADAGAAGGWQEADRDLTGAFGAARGGPGRELGGRRGS